MVLLAPANRMLQEKCTELFAKLYFVFAPRVDVDLVFAHCRIAQQFRSRIGIPAYSAQGVDVVK